MEQQRSKPSSGLYVIGVAILVLGCAGAAILFAFGVAGMVDSALEIDQLISDFDRVVVPGSAQLQLDEAGAYFVFYEYRSVVDGESFHSSRSCPELNCTLRVKESGQQVRLTNTWPQQSNYELLDRAGTMFMRFNIDRPDTYVLSCEYAGTRNAPDVVLAVGTGFVRGALDLAVKVMGGLLAPFALACGAGVVGLLAIAVVAVLRHRSASPA